MAIYGANAAGRNAGKLATARPAAKPTRPYDALREAFDEDVARAFYPTATTAQTPEQTYPTLSDAIIGAAKKIPVRTWFSRFHFRKGEKPTEEPVARILADLEARSRAYHTIADAFGTDAADKFFGAGPAAKPTTPYDALREAFDKDVARAFYPTATTARTPDQVYQLLKEEYGEDAANKLTGRTSPRIRVVEEGYLTRALREARHGVPQGRYDTDSQAYLSPLDTEPGSQIMLPLLELQFYRTALDSLITELGAKGDEEATVRRDFEAVYIEARDRDISQEDAVRFASGEIMISYDLQRWLKQFESER